MAQARRVAVAIASTRVAPSSGVGATRHVEGNRVPMVSPDNPLVQRWLRRAKAARAFATFVWQRFWDDRCLEAAGSLSYTTIFSLVPLTAVALGVVASFPVFNTWTETITDFLFQHFVPAAAQVVRGYLTQFAANAVQLTSIGVLALIASALLTMSSVEETFNRIWRVSAGRRRVARFVVYWTVLTLGPILIVASLALTSVLFALPPIGDAEREWRVGERLLLALPLVVTFGALLLAYLVIPATYVRVRHAVVGAVIATVLFELAKRGFAEYLARTSYERVFGAIAVIPTFLVWIYLSWLIVLLGGSIAAALGAFRYDWQRGAPKVAQHFFVLLRVLKRVAAASRSGTPISRAALVRAEPDTAVEDLERAANQLIRARLVGTSASGLVLLRDPASVGLAELFEAGAHRMPSLADLALLREQVSDEDRRLVEWLDAAANAQQCALSVRAGDVLFDPVSEAAAPTAKEPR